MGNYFEVYRVFNAYPSYALNIKLSKCISNAD